GSAAGGIPVAVEGANGVSQPGVRRARQFGRAFAGVGMSRIVSRKDWGARPAKRPVSVKTNQKGWELHHSTGSHDINGARRMRSVQSGHLDHKKINYADIAYNFCV